MIYLFYNECELLKVKNLPFYIKISIKKNYCTATICAASISGTVNESYYYTHFHMFSFMLLSLCFNNNYKKNHESWNKSPKNLSPKTSLN